MFLWDWLSGLMIYLGLWRRPVKLIFTGLDNTGKTTMLYMLSDDPRVNHGNHPTQATVTIDDVCCTIYELCSYQYWRRSRMAESYLYQVADGIVYFIDAADSERFEESQTELNKLLSDEKIADIPVLILGNKTDRPNAASEEEIQNAFHLHDKTTGKANISLNELQRRPLEVFMCSILKRTGYGEGFRWLSQYIQK